MPSFSHSFTDNPLLVSFLTWLRMYDFVCLFSYFPPPQDRIEPSECRRNHDEAMNSCNTVQKSSSSRLIHSPGSRFFHESFGNDQFKWTTCWMERENHEAYRSSSGSVEKADSSLANHLITTHISKLISLVFNHTISNGDPRVHLPVRFQSSDSWARATHSKSIPPPLNNTSFVAKGRRDKKKTASRADCFRLLFNGRWTSWVKKKRNKLLFIQRPAPFWLDSLQSSVEV